MSGFAEVKLFQVKPDKLAEFEDLVAVISKGQREQVGCLGIRYMKRFYTIDGVELGEPPRELTKIVKCVKYYAYWEFDCKENYGKATKWFFDEYLKVVQRLLIMPFDINCGDSVVSLV
ncbi:MAG: antibiotic biosynthesis monooxygenase [Defluviitaleaceae bacterium]|nr:antibiotic biosynthesis monooxygenase [Defluviitaleaceae bacterium]